MKDGTSGRAISRRALFKAGAALAVFGGAPLVPRPLDARQRPGAADDAGTLEPIWRQSVSANQYIHLKGGTVVSMDPKVGDFATGDILIQGKKIVAVGPEVKAPASAQVIDASNTVMIPGFVDPHRHAWEGQLRRIIPDGPIAAYGAATHRGFAPYYRPQDHYAANLITALGCIDGGITCIVDNSHNSRSGAHSDAAIRALFDSGVRAEHAAGGASFGEWDRQYPQDLVRLQKQFFTSDDQLVTLRLYSTLNRENWAFARKLGLRISSEANGAANFADFAKEKLLGPDNTFNHCNGWSDEVWQWVKDAGCTVNVTPRSDPQYGLGEGVLAFQKALDHGMLPGLSIDNETSYGGDMFTEMRVAFNIQRGMVAYRRAAGDPAPPALVTTRQILECATVGGAANAGLLHKCGTLTPGKEADIVLIRTNDINLYPSNHAIGSVVAAADSRNVDTVIIAGKVRKLRGQMVGVNMDKFRQMGDESRNYLFAKAGYTLDVLSSKPF